MNLPQFTIANSQLCMLRALNKRRREWFLDWLTFNYKVYMQIASITKRVKHNKHWITITNQNQYRNQISCQFHKLLCKSGITRGASKDSKRERPRQKEKQIWKNNHTEAQSDRYEDRRGATSMWCWRWRFDAMIVMQMQNEMHETCRTKKGKQKNKN